MTWALIVNPFASKVSEASIDAVEAALPGAVSILRTERAGQATEHARELVGSVDAIAVFGGDGTFNEVLNGVGRATTPLGFLPGGGTSVLPRALGLPRDPVAAARRVARGRTRRIGVGRVTGRRFGFNAGLGLDAELVRAIDGLGRRPDGRRPGDRAFVRTAAGIVLRRGIRFDTALEIEGLGRAAFALVANCAPYTYLGKVPLRVARDASFAGGLDLVAPVVVRPWSLPRLVAQATSGIGERGLLRAHDVDRLVIRCDAPTPLQVDGEDLGDVQEVVVEAERDAVTVLV